MYTSHVLSMTKYNKRFLQRTWKQELQEEKPSAATAVHSPHSSSGHDLIYARLHITTTPFQPFSIKVLTKLSPKGINWCCCNSNLFQEKIALKWDDSCHKDHQKYHWEQLKNKLLWRKREKKERAAAAEWEWQNWLEITKSLFSSWREQTDLNLWQSWAPKDLLDEWAWLFIDWTKGLIALNKQIDHETIKKC